MEREFAKEWVERDGSGNFVIRSLKAGTEVLSITGGERPGLMSDEITSFHSDGNKLIISGYHPPFRPFFNLQLSNSDRKSFVIAERKIPFKGCYNFRDLGGYPTKDGRKVKWGTVFRSDQLLRLNNEDLELLESLKIKVLCDLRHEEERKKAVNRLPENNQIQSIHLPIYDERLDPGLIRKKLEVDPLKGIDYHQVMIDVYQDYILKFTYQFKEIFNKLLDSSNLPLLFHCIGGKDRTGIASVLLLSALGVPENIVLYDYILTSAFTKNWLNSLSTQAQMPEPLIPLFVVHKDYIQGAFDGVNQTYGSLDAYLKEALDLDEAKCSALQDLLLEPV
ncbi:tyrosine-protein phosphatase [Deltaproteobacteria bacterium TL4]